jgi:ribosomal protein L11
LNTASKNLNKNLKKEKKMENKEIKAKIKVNTESNTAEITITTPDGQKMKLTEKVKFKRELPTKKEIKKLLYRLLDSGILEEINKNYGDEQTFELSNGSTLTNKTLDIKVELTMEVKKEYEIALATSPLFF